MHSENFGLISFSETLDKYGAWFFGEQWGKEVIPSGFFFRFTERLEQACSVYEEAAILLTPELELIAQMSGLRSRLVGGPFMSWGFVGIATTMVF